MNDQPIHCCERLASKTMYFDPDERPGRLREGDTVPFTCLQTMSPVGPDNSEAKPSLCQPNRSCYEGDRG